MSFGVTNPSGSKLQSTTIWKATDQQSAAQTDTELQATPGTGLSLYITDVIISNGATAGAVKLVENTATAATVLETIYLPINGHYEHHFETPVKLTAAYNLGYTSVTCTTHSITVCGFTAP